MGIREPGKLYAAVESLLEYQKPENMFDVETDVQLAAKDQVDILLDYVRPAVLLDFLTKFAADHRTTCDDEWPEIDQETADRFLAGLDALRAPAYPSQDMLRRAVTGGRMLLRDELSERVDALSKLPWSGDLTYGQALADVRSALHAAAEGKPTPTPDWQRCTSEYLTVRDVKVRCQKALPHGDEHEYAQGNGEVVLWPDERSVNPPQCTEWKNAKDMRGRCNQPAGHEGDHTSKGFKDWS